MGQFSETFTAGRVALADETTPRESLEPRQYVFANRTLKCAHCSEKLFLPSRAILGGNDDAEQSLEWNTPATVNLVCAECGRIESFVQVPETPAQSDGSETRGPIDLSRIPDLD